jgi:cytochrome o ubiquinol oxidase subunit 3
MTQRPAHDPVPLGLWVYIMSDCVLFASLFAAYAVLHTETAGGAGSMELFDRSFVLVETLILLASSFTCGLAVIAARWKHAGATWAALLATLMLGLAFVSMELSEFMHLMNEGWDWSASAFLSSFFALVGTHGLHILVGSLWMLALLVHLAVRGLSPQMTRRIQYFSLFWHFLDIVWICIFSFVYLFGSLPL